MEFLSTLVNLLYETQFAILSPSIFVESHTLYTLTLNGGNYYRITMMTPTKYLY